MLKLYSLRRNLPKVAALVITFITISASTAGVVKIAKSFTHGNTNEVPEVQVLGETDENVEGEEGVQADSISGGITVKPTNTATPTTKPSAKFAGKPVIPTSPVSSTLGSSVENVAIDPNACIITLFGKQYDVTSLRSSHPGGDVFNCGADNTSLYQSAHGTDVSRMQAYLVGSGGTAGGTGAGTTSGSASGGWEYEDGDEEEEYEQQKKEMEKELERQKNEWEDEHENDGD